MINEYLIPYNDNIIDKIDINNKRIYIKDTKVYLIKNK